MAGTVELPWKGVRDAELDGAVLGIRAAVWTRGGWLGRLNQRATPYEVSFKAAAFADEAEDIVRAIERYRGDARRRRAIGTEEEQARCSGARVASRATCWSDVMTSALGSGA